MPRYQTKNVVVMEVYVHDTPMHCKVVYNAQRTAVHHNTHTLCCGTRRRYV